MSGDATRSKGDLPTGADRVLRGLAILGSVGVPVDELAAAVGLPEREVEEAASALARAGRLTAIRPGWYELADVPEEVSENDPEDTELDPQEVRRRFAEYIFGGVQEALRLRAGPSNQPPASTTRSGVPHVQHADTEHATKWLADHRCGLVAAVRISCEHGMHELGARLAGAVWDASPDIADRHWWADLSRWGEEAAIRWRNPPFLAELLDHSARFLRRVADFRGAEAQWVRALSIGRRIKETTIVVQTLDAMSRLYGVGGRLHRKLDAEFELLSWHQRVGSDLEVARARARIGSTMLAAGRADSAVEYLTEAVAEFAALGDSGERERADAVISLGRAYWQSGTRGAARRCFSQALAVLVERDPSAADSVRRLLRTEDDQPLPEQASGNGPEAARSPADE